MRHASSLGHVVRAIAIALLLVMGVAPLAHTAQHVETHGDCVMCLAHVASAAYVCDRAPLETPSAVRYATPPTYPSILHAGHGSPSSTRGPPVSQA